MINNRRFFQFILIITILASASSCIRKDLILRENNIRLEFSSDTLLFDTVFTQIGSTTKYFQVKNPYNAGIIELDEISLAGGSNSNYRLNIDGKVSNSESMIQILPGDSLFIFVEVTVDPTLENLPVLIEDSILFYLNDHLQQVKLLTYGQDYNFIDGQYIPSQTWTNEKPYVIYNSMAVDEGETLIIEEGCQLYFHRNSGFYILGSLIVNGSIENPVIFQGDRLEENYKEIPGQWDLIHFLPGSKDNLIQNAIIKNSIIGIQVDTFANDQPALTLINTQIRNQTAIGLYAQGSRVVAENCIFANCGMYAVVLNIGGDYEFTHCTISNYYQYGNRATPSVLINNYYEDINGNIQLRAIEKAFFTNCIIYGDKENEIGLDRYQNQPGLFNFYFNHCLIKVKTIESSDAFRFIDCINNQSPRLEDPYKLNWQPDSLSPALDAALIQASFLVPNDLFGNSRLNDLGPDIGAIERQPYVQPTEK